MTAARIMRSVPAPGTRWRLPWTLWGLTGWGWRPVGRYLTERGARAAARRSGLTLEAGHRRLRPSTDWRI